MIFEIGYRETICKDGLANRLEEGATHRRTYSQIAH